MAQIDYYFRAHNTEALGLCPFIRLRMPARNLPQPSCNIVLTSMFRH